MKVALTYSHHAGLDVARTEGIYDEIMSAFDSPGTKWGGKGSGERARRHVSGIVQGKGWSSATSISAHSDLKILWRKGDCAFHMQTGNISRAPYDLLKFQLLYLERRISLAVYGVPTSKAARACGKASNVASAERIIGELQVFDRIITTPLFLIGFE